MQQSKNNILNKSSTRVKTNKRMNTNLFCAKYTLILDLEYSVLFYFISEKVHKIKGEEEVKYLFKMANDFEVYY